MTHFLRWLLATALIFLPLAEASAGNSTITTKDATGVTKTFYVVTDGSSNFYSAGVICDQSAAATCASVGTAGSPSTNALTVQAVTIGHGTAANAMRVELPTDGTGLVNAAQSGTWNVGTVTTVTTLSTLTGGGVASGAADSGNPLKTGGKYNLAPITLADGNRGDLQLDVNGYAKVNVTNATTALPNNADTVAVQTGAANSPVNNYNYVFNGTTWDRARSGGTTGYAGVTGVGTAGTANAGVLTVQGIASMTPLLVTPAANSAVNVAQINGVTPLMGNGATGTGSPRATLSSDNSAIALWGHGATAASVPANGVFHGLRGQNAEQTAVTNGQLVGAAADLVGKLIMLPYANPENFVQGTTTAITDTTSTSVIASAGGSLRNYITDCVGTNSHATVGTFVKILDGSTIIDEFFAAPAGGGASRSYPVPRKGTAATAINAQMVTTGANVIVSCGGYKGI